MNNLQQFRQNSKYLQAALAIIEHRSLSAAAQAVKISRTTLWRWLRTEDFLTILRACQAQAAHLALARLAGSVDQAAGILLTEMTNHESTPAVRVTADRAVIRLATHSP